MKCPLLDNRLEIVEMNKRIFRDGRVVDILRVYEFQNICREGD